MPRTEDQTPGGDASEDRSSDATKRVRRRRWLGWIAFFLAPFLILAALFWPETPDLPLDYWGSNCAIDYHAEFLPGDYVEGSAVLGGPTLSLGRELSLNRKLGSHRLELDLELIAVTDTEAVFGFRGQQKRESESFILPVQDELSEIRVPLGGSHRIEPWPGLDLHIAFVPDRGKGWRHHWKRWDQNFDLSFLDWLW